MKRFLSVLLCAAMLFGIAATCVSAQTVYLGEAITTAPTIDGVIGEGEYQYDSGVLNTKATTEDVLYMGHSNGATTDKLHTSRFYVGYDSEYIYLGYVGFAEMSSHIVFYINPSIASGTRDTYRMAAVYNWKAGDAGTGGFTMQEMKHFTADTSNEYTGDECNWSDYVIECAGVAYDNNLRNANTLEFKLDRSAFGEIAFDQIGIRAFIQPECSGSAGEFYWGANPSSSIIPYADVLWFNSVAGFHVFNLYDIHQTDGVIVDGEYSWTSGKYDRNTNVTNEFVVVTAHSDTIADGLWSQYWLDYDEDYIYIAYNERGAYKSEGWIDINPRVGLGEGNTTGQIFIYYSFTRNNEYTEAYDVTIGGRSFATDGSGNYTENIPTYVVSAKGMYYDDGMRNQNTLEFKIDRTALEEYAGSEFDTLGFRSVIQSAGEALYCNTSSKYQPVWFHEDKGYHTVNLFPEEEDADIDGVFSSGEYCWSSPVYDKKVPIDDEYYVVSEYSDPLSLTCQYLVNFDDDYLYLGFTERTNGFITNASIDLAPILSDGSAKGQLHFDIYGDRNGLSITGRVYADDGSYSNNLSNYVVQTASSWWDDGHRNNNQIEIKLDRKALETYVGATFNKVGLLGISKENGGIGVFGNENAADTLLPICEYEGIGYNVIKIEYNVWVKFSETHHASNDGQGTVTYGFHDWDEGEIISAATETEDGKISYTCTVCGAVDKDVIPATGHSLIRVEAKASTCTESGYTQHKVCEHEECNYKYKYEIVAATGHTEVELPRVEASCSATGLTAGVKCDKCGEVLTAQTVIPALEHSYDNNYDVDCNFCGAVREVACAHENTTTTEENRVEATCTVAGSYIAVESCDSCGEEIGRTTIEIPVIPHTEVTIPSVDASCTKTGLSEGKKCSVCDTVLVAQETVKKLRHNYATATDVGGGEHRFTCTVCSVTRTEKHNFVISDGVNKCAECPAVPETVFDLGAVGQKHEYVGEATKDAPVITSETFESSKYNELAKVEYEEMTETTKNDYFFWSEGMQIGYFKIYVTYDAGTIYLAAEVDTATYASSDKMTFNITTGRRKSSFTLSGENSDITNDVFVSSKIFAPNGASGVAVYAVEIDREGLATIAEMATGSSIDNQIAVSAEYTNSNSQTATFGTTATETVTDTNGENIVESGALVGMALTLGADDDTGDTLSGYGESTSIGISGVSNFIEADAVVSVSLNWNTPTFAYNAAYKWNPQTLENDFDAENSGWSVAAADITVVNNSNQAISVGFSFATTAALKDSGINGKFTADAVVDTDSDSDVDMADLLATPQISGNTIILESAAPDEGETHGTSKSDTVYFYLTDGVLPLTHDAESSIGYVTITIGGQGN